MSNQTIDPALVVAFDSSIHEKSQQVQSRYRPHVIVKYFKGEKMMYDGLGDVEAREVHGRSQPVQFNDIEHLRRVISRRRFTVTLPIDEMDVNGILMDAEGKYASAVVYAMERQFDRVVSQAAFADVKTGKEGENTVTFANDGGVTIDATAGLTYAKLLEIDENFLNKEVGTEFNEHVTLSISGNEHTQLMNEQKLTSGDYSRHFVADKGRMTEALGMKLIKFGGGVNIPVLNVNSSSERRCIAMSHRAICVGINQESQVKVEDRPDLEGTKQVKITRVFGAVRTEGVLIQELLTTAS